MGIDCGSSNILLLTNLIYLQPEPKKDHTSRMALFAADCLTSMSVQVQSLEEELGPETADLGIRIGLHSGPVTAGVLRGGES